MQTDQLTGSEKAAILILSLPRDEVKSLLARLQNEEVERILAAVSRFEEVPPKVQEQVLSEFREAIGTRETAIRGGRQRALELVGEALEGERASQVFEKLDRDEKRVDWTLRPFEPQFIADTLAGEHPQTLAVVLSQLPSERGAKVIACLPEALRPEVLLRLANLDTVATDAITEVEEEIALMFARRRSSPTRAGGADVAAKLLNRVKKSDGTVILEGVDTRDPDVAGRIKKLMLTFNDLVTIDKRGFQSLLREVPTEDLVVALKTATDEMKAKVFENVSSRAGEQIREEMELLGPMRLSEVEAIQAQIVDVARRLEDEGKLTIDAGGGDDALV